MTDEKVHWLISQNFENIIPEEANEIGFTSAKTKKARLEKLSMSLLRVTQVVKPYIHKEENNK